MRARRLVPPLLLALAAAAAFAGSRGLARDAEAPRPQRNEREDRRALVAWAPPPGAIPASAAEAAQRAERELGAAPRTVVDASQAGDSASARLVLDPSADRWVLGELAAPSEHRVAIASQPAGAPPALEAIRYPERVPAARAAAVEAEGRSLDPARCQLWIDGARIENPQVSKRGSGVLVFSIPPLAPGRHEVAVSGGGAEAPVEGCIEVLPPPLALCTGPVDGLVARALAAQGFEARPFDPGAARQATLLVVASPASPFREVADAVAAGGAALLVGPGTLEAAERSPLAEWLPGRLRPKPPEPPPASSPALPNDAPASPLPEMEPPAAPKEPAAKGPAVGDPKVKKGVEDVPLVALALVIDRSGSMFGEKMSRAKQSAYASAELLAPDDFITILSFDTVPTVEYQLSRAGALDLIRRKLEAIGVGGGTRFYNAIVEAVNQLERASLAARHIVLITDGASEDRYTSDFRALLTQRLAPQGITLSTVFIEGEGDQDADFLRLLAAWGRGQAYSARNSSAIPAIVLAEVRRKFGIPEGASRRVAANPEGTPRPAPPEKPKNPPTEPRRDPPKPPPEKPKDPPKPAAVPVEAAPGSAIVEGIDVAGLPPVVGARPLDPAPGASVALRGGGGALLALRAAGAGSLGSFAIEERGGLDAWEGDPRLQAILGRVAAALGRPPEPASEPAPLEARVVGGVLLARGADARGLLDPWDPPSEGARAGVRRREVGGALSGATTLLPDGRRESSLRRAATAADERFRVPAPPPSLRGNLPATRPEEADLPHLPAPSHAVAWLLAAAALAVAAAAAGRVAA